MKTVKKRFVPLVVALGIVIGILIGSFYANHFSGRRLNIINNSNNKISNLLLLIDDQYVDTVNIDSLVEKSLPKILKELDPHSVYIGANDVNDAMQDLKGSFSGIGVRFNIYKDTVRIVSVIKGGPSEHVGLKAGDRIIAVDGEPYVGKQVSNETTIKKLKGEAGTQVRVKVKRAASAKPLEFKIVRGDVPVPTVDAVYMVNDETGYIRISSFGETTYPEFLSALSQLREQGFKKLILDLRGNLGGYMNTAVQIANEFLPQGRLIVYTKGRKSRREDYRSDGRGSYQHMPVVVLVDESSASASEILAGAFQDNDRGTVIGRRTFGKGLVQVPIEFPDGSMIRLTTARYYTPSGRCVQKPYTPGDEEDYDNDLLLRAEHGEYYSADSIRLHGPKFKTRLGRTVYGGGGIVPDVFVPRDTLGFTSYFKEAYLAGLINSFAYAYVDANRKVLEKKETLAALVSYLKRQNLVEQFARFAEREGLKRRNRMIAASRKLIENYLMNGIIYDVLDLGAAVEYSNSNDPFMERALEALNEKNATRQSK